MGAHCSARSRHTGNLGEQPKIRFLALHKQERLIHLPRWENRGCSDMGAPLPNAQPKASPGCRFAEPGCVSKKLFWQRIACLSCAPLFVWGAEAKLSRGGIPAQQGGAAPGECLDEGAVPRPAARLPPCHAPLPDRALASWGTQGLAFTTATHRPCWLNKRQTCFSWKTGH